jgi:hypothetical protein
MKIKALEIAKNIEELHRDINGFKNAITYLCESHSFPAIKEVLERELKVKEKEYEKLCNIMYEETK